ncbi:HYC_CC_PP family protein [Pedobacter nutrimenti]
MKRLAVIFLLFIYTISIFGLAINKFYCCGNLTSISLFENSKFVDAAKTTKKGCCKLNKETFKVKDSHLASTTKAVDLTFFAIPIVPLHFPELLSPLTSNGLIAWNSKPSLDYCKKPIYILNCIYRI